MELKGISSNLNNELKYELLYICMYIFSIGNSRPTSGKRYPNCLEIYKNLDLEEG